MRNTRRRVLNLAGIIFLAVLLARIVFLITGLRTYATRPEIPYRILEMLIVLLAAVFTYYFSYRYGFLPMAAACLMGLYAPVRELISGEKITIGSLDNLLDTDGYIFDILLIAGFLMMAALCVLTCPLIKRNEQNALAMRALSVGVTLIFAAQLVYQVIILTATLIEETYPGQYTTKYYYTLGGTYLALVMVGFACYLTISIRPSQRHRKADPDEE